MQTVFDPIDKEQSVSTEGADMSKLQPDEITALNEQTEVLAKKYNVSKVHAVVFIDPETKERTVAFLKEPNYLTKIRIMDKAAILGVYSAADELREATILQEESDAKTYGDTYDCDRYKMGVTEYCITMVQKLNNQFKKK